MINWNLEWIYFKVVERLGWVGGAEKSRQKQNLIKIVFFLIFICLMVTVQIVDLLEQNIDGGAAGPQAGEQVLWLLTP